MARYPFMDYVNEYMEKKKVVITEETYLNRMRRYRRIDRKVAALKEDGRISSASPKSFTVEDAFVILTSILEDKQKNSGQNKQNFADLKHDINALNQLCNSVDNLAVAKCLDKYPQLSPSLSHDRLTSISENDCLYLFERAARVDDKDFEMIRAYGLVAFCIGTGCRNKEVRLANLRDLNTRDWVLTIKHVKGESTYGKARKVIVMPDARPAISRYLEIRTVFVDPQSKSDAIFTGASGYLSADRLRRIKNLVQKDSGISFELRDCRRTFGQRLLDMGAGIETVSKLMGHSTTKTTEGYYCGMDNDIALKNTLEVLSATPI